MERKTASDIRFTDTIGRTVKIAKVGGDRWEWRQRSLGKNTDNAQNPTWVKVENLGRRRKIEISLFWADTEWPHWRAFGYRKIGDTYTAVRGEPSSDRTVYRVEVPEGVSWFGAAPWYANEDADAFLARMEPHPLCRARTIGKTARGRPIRCLTVGRGETGLRNVVVHARTHATETPGSFAVEGIAEYLVDSRAGNRLLRKRVFHLFPNVNPDGVAAGLKFTRRGPKEKYDMSVATMSSTDETMVAARRDTLRLRPACFIDFHSYLQSVPGFFFYDRRFGLDVQRELLRDRQEELGLYVRWLRCEGKYRESQLTTHCHLHCGSTVALFELSWNFGLLPDDMRRMGAEFFRAVMKGCGSR